MITAERMIAFASAEKIRDGLALLIEDERRGWLTPDQAEQLRAEYLRALDLLAARSTLPDDSSP